MRLLVKDIVNITGGKLVCGDENTIIDNYYSESKKELPNGLFLGIKGIKDGSMYYKDAIEHGAKACLINNIEIDYNGDAAIIVVDDTIKAMRDIAIYIRSNAKGKFVGITGSVGKTCVKDFIYAVLNTTYKTMKNEGNLNNNIGLPKTIMRYTDEEYEVSEIGMNHAGEILPLAEILKPNIAVYTNIGTSHIGNLGSRENIFKEKITMLDVMKLDDPVILNNDDDILHEYYLKHERNNMFTYGINEHSDLMAKDIILNDNYTEYTAVFENTEFKIRVNVPGIAYVYNSLAAVAVGLLEGVTTENIALGLSNASITGNRMEITKFSDFTLISDCYNSAYASIEAALQVLSHMNGKKIVFLGEVFELGDYAVETHKEIGRLFKKYPVDTLITIGDMTKNVIEESGMEDIYNFNTKEEGYVKLKEYLNNGSNILIKASNSLRFFDIADDIKKNYK